MGWEKLICTYNTGVSALYGIVRVNHHRACDQTIFLVCVLMRGNTYLHIQMHSKLAQEINNMVKRFFSR